MEKHVLNLFSIFIGLAQSNSDTSAQEQREIHTHTTSRDRQVPKTDI